MPESIVSEDDLLIHTNINTPQCGNDRKGETERAKGSQKHRHSQRIADEDIENERERETERDRERERQKKERERGRQGERKTEQERDRERERDRQRDKDRERKNERDRQPCGAFTKKQQQTNTFANVALGDFCPEKRVKHAHRPKKTAPHGIEEMYLN